MLLAIPKLPFSAKFPNHSLPPPKQSSTREREYLRPSEVNAIERAARQVGRHGVRDATINIAQNVHVRF